MGEVKSSTSPHLRYHVSNFKDVLTFDGKVLFCQAWRKSTVTQQHSQVIQNWVDAIVHLKDQQCRQSLIGESSDTSSSSEPSKFATFMTDLGKAFVSADMPLFKINNPEFPSKVYSYRFFR
jgi:hypothetical protein